MLGRPTPSDEQWYQRLWRLHRRHVSRQHAYRAIPAAVLADLASFCYAHAPAVSAREIGRRDVWLYIMQYVEMDDEELAVLKAGLTPEQRYQIYHPGSPAIIEEE